MWEDVIVEEVRQVRDRHAKQFNFDLWAIYQDLQQQEIEGQRKLVVLPAKKRRRTASITKSRPRPQAQVSQAVQK